MITYVTRKNIDIIKYDACIQNSINSRVYALSYYLDIVADNWDALILDNYKAVMPLPWRSKYFIKYIYPPCWTQQLGVFSTNKLDISLIDNFIKAIPKKFLKTTIQFHSNNYSDLFLKKDNYILDLNHSYEELHKNYRKDRKDRLKKFNKSECTLEKNISAKKITTLFKENYTNELNINLQDYRRLEQLATTKKLTPITLGVFDKERQLISGSLFFKDANRIYYVFSANNKKGNKVQGNTAVLNHIIQTYANTNYTLDFEGSMHPGIASFFKSFGSKMEAYYLLTKLPIDSFLSSLKK
ncbi:hypothetical protein FHR24_000087 [Wenyingzhuangia heitensis]|uniref:Acetyltransferase (GNAT) domain-containing protein n=1 Tax=Wenyingzhuangia heitensis TaxID=1487859 RepID=A0ABX0U451_9FLAO|nr:hypothetical protein [Wenyingzhuangia heitensis]NIJ43648.1 hypothetical protein [Wenyingzhuangia heitensis]